MQLLQPMQMHYIARGIKTTAAVAAFCCTNRAKEMKTYGYRRPRSASTTRDTAAEGPEAAADTSLSSHAR